MIGRSSGEPAITRRCAELGGGRRDGARDSHDRNKEHRDDLRNMANTVEALPRRGNKAGWHSAAAPWPTGLDVAGTVFQGTNQQMGGTGKKGSSPRVIGRGARRPRRLQSESLTVVVNWGERECMGEWNSKHSKARTAN